MISKGNITIAYPDSAPAKRVASILEKKLSGYHIPSDVRRRKGIGSLREIGEKWLIVCCTPQTGKDGEIISLINEFIAEGLREHVLTVLISGKPEESFPEELRFRKLPDGTEEELEPLAANLTEDSSRKKINTESLRLFAPMLGVSFDELNRRDLKRKMKAALIAGAAVILFSAAFLYYSVNRQAVINGQNIELKAQYDIRKQAEEDMVAQKNEAVYQNRLLLSKKAEEAYDAYDMQQALLYCLEAIDEDDPDSMIDEMRDVFDNALNVSCSSGYVPITSNKVYTDIYGSNYTDMVYTTGDFENSFMEEFPEDVKNHMTEMENTDLSDRQLIGEFQLKDYSEKYGYAVYYCSYSSLDLDNSYYFTKVCFKDDPEKDYYLKDQEGKYLGLYKVTAFENGKFISQFGNRDAWYEFDAQTGEMTEAFLSETDEDRYRKCAPGVSCFHTDDRQYIIILEHRSETFEVYLPETGKRLYMKTGPWINANRHSSYTLDDGRNYQVFFSSKGYIYETGTGRLTEISSDDAVIKLISISSEGYVAVKGDREFMIYDLESGQAIAEIPKTSTDDTGDTMFMGKPGKYNRVYGAEIFGSGKVIFEYHKDAVPVPEGHAEKIRLAKKLLGKRLEQH